MNHHEFRFYEQLSIPRKIEFCGNFLEFGSELAFSKISESLAFEKNVNPHIFFSSTDKKRNLEVVICKEIISIQSNSLKAIEATFEKMSSIGHILVRISPEHTNSKVFKYKRVFKDLTLAGNNYAFPMSLN